ncbi:MAG: hypothetical protein ACLUN9_10780 [Enterocloster aldenensis]
MKLCAMCPTSNIWTGAARNYEEHPAVTMMREGTRPSVPDDPPYGGSGAGYAIALMRCILQRMN